MIENYWLEIAKMKNNFTYTCEIISRYPNKFIQIQEEKVVILGDINSGNVSISYISISNGSYHQILSWEGTYSISVKTILKVRKYDGLGDMIESWDITDPVVDFTGFNSYSELGFLYGQQQVQNFKN